MTEWLKKQLECIDHMESRTLADARLSEFARNHFLDQYAEMRKACLAKEVEILKELESRHSDGDS